MATWLTWTDWLANIASPVVDLQTYIASELVKKACFLSDKYPALVQINSPGGQFLEYLCSQVQQTPPFDPPPFTGGNCPEFYGAKGFYVEANDKRGCGTIGVWESAAGGVLGPVIGINPNPAGSGTLLGQNNTSKPLIVDPNISGCPNPSAAISKVTVDCNFTTPQCTPLAKVEQRFITEVFKIDGSPDDCGDAYPYPPDPPSNPNDFNFFLDFDYTDTNGDPHNYSIFGDVVINNNLNIPFQFNLGGVQVILDFGGVSDFVPSPDPGGGGGGGNSPGDEVPPPADNPELDEETKPPGESEEEDGIERLAWVTLDITNIPSNIKSQYGGVSAPDVLYLGWFEFRSGSYNFPRSPIHFDKNIFEAPLSADGYAYTLYLGATGEAKVYTVKTTT